MKDEFNCTKDDDKMPSEYAIFVPHGDRSLNAIHLSEQPDEYQIGSYVKHLCGCLSFMHGGDTIQW